MILTILFEKFRLIKILNNFLFARLQFVFNSKYLTDKIRTISIKIKKFKSDDDEKLLNIIIEELTNEDS